MQKNLDKRINQILDSTKGSQRAKPREQLLAKIESQIYGTTAAIIPLRQLRVVAAAAVLLLMLNGWAVKNYLEKGVYQGKEAAVKQASESLILNYKLYEE